MMEIMKSTGESSSRGREDGDGATGSERPLKKARFAWQVKGKYHLKNEIDESNKHLTKPTAPCTSEPTSKSQDSSNTLTNKMENYLIQQDYSKFNSVINSDSSLLSTLDNLTTETQYPRYMSTYERTSNNMLRSNCCNSIKTVSMPDKSEDLCIAQWQAKQFKKSCLDNTLNRVLETWTTEPLPAEEANSRFLALDFAEFINHLPGDNSIENEGILMAISAHGLQNTPSSSSNDASYTDNCSISSAHIFDTPSPSLKCSSPNVFDDDSHDTNLQNYETKNKISSEIHDWQTDNQDTNDFTHFAYHSEPSQSPYHYSHDSHQNSNTDSLDAESHFDFMNAAVLFAIKSKGLTASGTDYG